MRLPPFFIAILVAARVLTGAEQGKAEPHDQAAIDKAMAGVATAAAKVHSDTNRPAFHLLPPANWMNDPNGPIHHNGWYHMFYQHNPYGDEWGHMHWGHARSRDMLKWEHLPIALWPSKEAGEEHVFSGCATINGRGEPMIFYTAIFQGKSATDYAEQWAAIGDETLTTWRKHPENPILKPEIHGDVKLWDWRDPFLFKYKDGDYMVLGGNLNHGQGGQGIVALYKAENPELTRWKYVGILFTHPDPKVTNIECPNFFELDGRWVLIVSPHRQVEYFTGTFDGEKFVSQKSGLVDGSGDFYAPNSTTDDKGRRLLWGWMRGFKNGQGWNGCLTLPRVLRVDEKGQLRQSPATEVDDLRAKRIFSDNARLGRSKSVSIPVNSNQTEIKVSFWSNNQASMRINGQATDKALNISYGDGLLHVGDRTVPLALHSAEPLSLRIFFDRSLLEVYASGKACMSMPWYSGGIAGIELSSNGGGSLGEVSVYDLALPGSR